MVGPLPPPPCHLHDFFFQFDAAPRIVFTSQFAVGSGPAGEKNGWAGTFQVFDAARVGWAGSEGHEDIKR